MALVFTTTREAAQLRGIKFLVYGRAGAGKTRLCATAPAPLILSAEAGLLSLSEYDIPVIQIKTVDDLTEAHEFCETSEHAKGFATICLDSITEIAETVLTNAKKTTKDPRQAYGVMIDQLNMTIKAFRDLEGVNVLITAKQEFRTDEVSGVSSYGPMMPGKQLSQQLPYLFDEVFQLGIGRNDDQSTYRYLRTQPDLQYEAKDRSGRLDELEPPDLNAIITKILSR